MPFDYDFMIAISTEHSLNLQRCSFLYNLSDYIKGDA